VSESPVFLDDGHVLIRVWAVAGASRTEVVGIHGDRLKVRIAAPAEDDKANQALAEHLSRELDASTSIIGGRSSRAKLFQVSGVRVEDVARKLGLRP